MSPLSHGLVGNLSFLVPSSSYINTTRSELHTASFFPFGAQHNAVILFSPSPGWVTDCKYLSCMLTSEKSVLVSSK